MKFEIKSWLDSKILFSIEIENGTLRMALEAAVKSRANLFGAYLSGASLSRADLSGANLSEANLFGAYLSGADLSEANLSGANLSGAYLSGASLSRANLSGANLSEANLFGAYLSRADLSGANLSGANLFGAYLSEANLFGEKLTKNPIQILGLKWEVLITEKHIKIGCQVHEVQEWFKFDDEKIASFHEEALAWWKIWKPIIEKAYSEHVK